MTYHHNLTVQLGHWRTTVTALLWDDGSVCSVRLSFPHTLRQLPEGNFMMSALIFSCRSASVFFHNFLNIVSAQPQVIVTALTWEVYWVWRLHFCLKINNDDVHFSMLCSSLLSVYVQLPLWISRLTPASFCCEMVWSWPPSGRGRLQSLPWLTSHCLRKEVRVRGKTNEFCSIYMSHIEFN